ncbi:hypothetical protein K3495_g12337 [Podosphaera aphanis]|nr:hypothetical protein K3495_g12337 [Podosphaera aphanis]
MKSLAILGILLSLFWSTAGASRYKNVTGAAKFMTGNELVACKPKNQQRIYSLSDTTRAANAAKAVMSNALTADPRLRESFLRSRLKAMRSNPNSYPQIWEGGVPGNPKLRMKYPLNEHEPRVSYEKQNYIYNDFIVLDAEFRVVEVRDGEDNSSCRKIPVNRQL